MFLVRRLSAAEEAARADPEEYLLPNLPCRLLALLGRPGAGPDFGDAAVIQLPDTLHHGVFRLESAPFRQYEILQLRFGNRWQPFPKQVFGLWGGAISDRRWGGIYFLVISSLFIG